MTENSGFAPATEFTAQAVQALVNPETPQVIMAIMSSRPSACFTGWRRRVRERTHRGISKEKPWLPDDETVAALASQGTPPYARSRATESGVTDFSTRRRRSCWGAVAGRVCEAFLAI